MAMNATDSLSLTFQALADPTRRAILEELAERPLAVGELAEGLPVSRPAVSQHLKVLRDAGLVQVRVDGNRRLYLARTDRLDELRAFLDAFWTGRLDRLKRAAERYDRIGFRAGLPEVWRVQAAVARAQGDTKEAVSLLTNAAHLANEYGSTDTLADIERDLSLALEKRGDQAGARAALDRHVADRHSLFHRHAVDRRAGVFVGEADAAVHAERPNDVEDDVFRVDAGPEAAVDLDAADLEGIHRQRLRGEDVASKVVARARMSR